MSRQRSYKNALFLSILSILLCAVMLVGTTLAWFSTTATSTGNRIRSGDLKIDLLMDKTQNGVYESIAEGSGDVFSLAEGNGNGIDWEPGKTELVFLRVENKGSFAVNYDIVLTAENIFDTGKSGTASEHKISDVLEYVLLDEMTADKYKSEFTDKDQNNWQGLIEAAEGNLGSLTEGMVCASRFRSLNQKGNTDDFLLAVHMRDDAGNIYQDKEVKIDIQIEATQHPYEEDSFGSDYDYYAAFPEIFSVDIVNNGTFEALSSSGIPRGWSTTNAKFLVDSLSGNIYSDHQGQGYISQNIYLEDYLINAPVREYTITADLNKRSTGGHGAIKLDFYQKVTDSLTGEESYAFLEAFSENFYQNKTSNGWEEITATFTMPENTAMCALKVRGIGENVVLSWDNIKISVELQAEQMSEEALEAARFRNMLAEEKSVSQTVEQTDPEKHVELPVLEGQPENLITNGNFENGLNGWSPHAGTNKDFVSLSENEGHNGTKAIKFSAKKEDGFAGNPIYEQVIDIVGGAEYQVSYWYRITEGDKNTPIIKFEAWGEVVNELVTGYADMSMTPIAYERDGEWHKAVMRFRMPVNSNKLFVMARMLTPNTSGEDQTVYLDDIVVCMTAAPEVVELHTDQIIYYTDSKNAEFQARANVDFFPNLKAAVTDFEVYEGQTLIWQQKGIKAENGIATSSMSIRGLRTHTAYCVKSITYHDDGTIAEVNTQNIYLYDRPKYLGTDGIFRNEGTEPVVPVIGYHVTPAEYARVKESGINVVQMAFSDAETALAYLNAAEEAGIMGLLALYYDMQPPSVESNIDRTVELLCKEEIVNHPALFGYLVMDEVYLHFDDPMEMLEESYRLIRSFDDKHPIMTLESLPLYFNNVGRVSDALLADAYATAESQTVYNLSTKAQESMYSAKPSYILIETYRTSYGRLASPEDARNNIWQALLGGAKGIGYFSINDAEKDDNDQYTIPLWDAKDNGALWHALCSWSNIEKNIAYEHFVYGKGERYHSLTDSDSPYWYYSWKVDGGLYLIVLGMERNQNLEVAIPLTNTEGTEQIGAFTAKVIAGDAENTSGNGTLNLTVNGVEAILYKITLN